MAIANDVAARMKLKEEQFIPYRFSGNIVFPFVQKHVGVSQGIVRTVFFLSLLSVVV